MSSLRLIDTVLLSSVVMESPAVFTRGCSPIPLTIPKSQLCLNGSDRLSHTPRTLLASIRKMGDYPCPRCLVPKENLKYMGTKEDMLNRINNSRVDDLNRKRKIKDARALIYAKGKPAAVDGKKVEALLKSESLVPISVS